MFSKISIYSIKKKKICRSQVESFFAFIQQILQQKLYQDSYQELSSFGSKRGNEIKHLPLRNTLPVRSCILLETYMLNYTEWTEGIGSATKQLGELEEITLVFLSVPWEREFQSSLTHKPVVNFKFNNINESSFCCQAPWKYKEKFLQKLYISSKGEPRQFCKMIKQFWKLINCLVGY